MCTNVFQPACVHVFICNLARYWVSEVHPLLLTTTNVKVFISSLSYASRLPSPLDTVPPGLYQYCQVFLNIVTLCGSKHENSRSPCVFSGISALEFRLRQARE